MANIEKPANTFCGRTSRREFIHQVGGGFTSLALTGMPKRQAEARKRLERMRLIGVERTITALPSSPTANTEPVL